MFQTVAVDVRHCPSWCVSGETDGEHVHVSADVAAGAPDQPLIARLISKEGDVSARVLVNDRVATVEQVDSFVGGLRRLIDQARPAEPGLGFVAALWANADATFSEVSAICGVEESRIRAQSRGGQVLTIFEYDQLALCLARITAAHTPAA